MIGNRGALQRLVAAVAQEATEAGQSWAAVPTSHRNRAGSAAFVRCFCWRLEARHVHLRFVHILTKCTNDLVGSHVKSDQDYEGRV